MSPKAEPAIEIQGLGHRYGDRQALCDVSLTVQRGEVFGLLGPNGGGKTTLFRLLNTSLTLQTGSVRILGFDPGRDLHQVRSRIGVVFQHPSLDKKLTVLENLKAHGSLYGMSRSEIRARGGEMLSRLGLADRGADRVETLSGGLARRVELAMGLMHRPELLILDEPSTGLDPGARRDLWTYLATLRAEGVTVLATTHLMDEASRCDRIGILDRGRLAALGEPESLRGEIGGEVLLIESPEPDRLAVRLTNELGVEARVFGGKVRIEHDDGLSLAARITQSARELVAGVSVARPTLEDVFIRKTGHRFWEEAGRE
jgi:ABC-2 type transport system ATP-binding protein